MRNWLFFVFFFFHFLGFSQEVESLKRVKLSWDEVEDSKAYELQVYKDEELSSEQIVSSLEWEAKLPLGSYKYRVRAIDAFDRPGVWTDFEEFKVASKGDQKSPSLTSGLDYSRRSSIGANLSWSQYDYSSQIGKLGSGNLSGGTALGVGADLHLWMWNRWGLDIKGSYISSKVEGVGVSYPELSLGLKYALLEQSKFFLNPLISFEYQNTPEFMFSSTSFAGFKRNLINSMSLGFGAEFGTALSEQWILQAHARYIWPFKIEGDGINSSLPDSALMYKFGLNLQYFWTPHWLVGLELGGDYRELSYMGQGKSEIEKNSYYLMLFSRYVFEAPAKQ
jgi:hypothetical protein